MQPAFWTKLYQNNKFPGRSIDQLKGFWKQWSELRLEDFLIDSFMTGRDYCLSHKKLPDPTIEAQFRESFAHDITEWEDRRANGEFGNTDEYEDPNVYSYHKDTP